MASTQLGRACYRVVGAFRRVSCARICASQFRLPVVRLSMLLVVALMGGSLSNDISETSSHRAATIIRAAQFYGSGWPVNYWSSNLSAALPEYYRMRSAGFNTVMLSVPWGYFEPSLTPPRFNLAAFAELRRLVETAGTVGLFVVLRISYEWDIDPYDQLSMGQRFESIFVDSQIYHDWLRYISAIHKSVEDLHNVRFAFLSWEDFWPFVQWAAAAAVQAGDQALILARRSGFEGWLKENYSLAQLSLLYRRPLDGYESIPVPATSVPAFQLIYRYFDILLVKHLFEPALRRYPGLVLESRVDEDPVYSGTSVLFSYSHTFEFDIPGTRVTGVYFNPAMGEVNGGQMLNATQGVSGMRTMLRRIGRLADGRQLFIAEFQFADNTPANRDNAHLAPGQVVTFLKRAAGLIRRYAIGYAVWTYRDYAASFVFNPDFALGLSGWQVVGKASAVAGADGVTMARLSRGTEVDQVIPLSWNFYRSGSELITVSFHAIATESDVVEVGLGGSTRRAVAISRGSRSYKVRLPAAGLSQYRLSLRSSGALSITDVRAYSFIQFGDVLNTAGGPDRGYAGVLALNRALSAGKG